MGAEEVGSSLGFMFDELETSDFAIFVSVDDIISHDFVSETLIDVTSFS